MFVDEHTLRVLVVHLAKRWHKYRLSDAGKYKDPSVTNDTTPHIYRKAMLVVAFDSSMRIIMGVSCIVDSISGKMGLVVEQNVTNHMVVRINPAAHFQPAAHVRR